MQIGRLTLYLATAWLTLAIASPAQTAAPADSRAERAFAAAKNAGPPELYAFLKSFPKGADLHMHLSGAIYAETFLREAALQDLCVDTAKLAFVKPAEPGVCAQGNVPTSGVAKDQKLYDALIDAFSMRGFVPSAGVSGHDQFFATFDRFGGLNDTYGQWLDEVATRAAGQNEQYLEIMVTPDYSNAVDAGNKLGWSIDPDGNIRNQLAKLRDELLAAGLRKDISPDRKEIDDAERQRADIEGCKDPAGDVLAKAGVKVIAEYKGTCEVKIRFIYQVLRGFPPQHVFAQTLLGFELASVDPDFVGINFVMPEDGYLSMTDYHLQMLMLDYLHSVYPKVHISLHAGELAPGMVPPAGLSFHIREAIDLGHAERIGHGVDLFDEDRPYELLKEMAEKHIMVEVNLTSNDVILGIKGAEHPLHAYMAAHVPWALSTDDEGVSRIDLTHEYVKGVEEQELSYADLKQSARTSLEHSFLPGPSLWTSADNFTHRQTACAGPLTLFGFPPGPCREFLSTSERAAEQYELEQRLAAFESAIR